MAEKRLLMKLNERKTNGDFRKSNGDLRIFNADFRKNNREKPSDPTRLVYGSARLVCGSARLVFVPSRFNGGRLAVKWQRLLLKQEMRFKIRIKRLTLSRLQIRWLPVSDIQFARCRHKRRTPALTAADQHVTASAWHHNRAQETRLVSHCNNFEKIFSSISR